METGEDQRGTVALMRDAIRQATALASTEITLAKLEAGEKLSLALASIVSIVVAAVFLIVALIFLLTGVVEVLVHFGFTRFVAYFIVGGGIAFVALIAILIAVRNLNSARLAPKRTLKQFEIAKSVISGGPHEPANDCRRCRMLGRSAAR